MKFARLAFVAHLVSSSANAFVPPSSSRATGATAPSIRSALTRPSVQPDSASSTSLSVLPVDFLDAVASSSALLLSSTDVDTGTLTTYLLEQLISSGVPALFWVIVIGFAGRTIASAAKEDREERFGGPGGAVQELYDDLYTDGGNKGSPFGGAGGFGPGGRRKSSKKNLGIPSKEYIKVTRLNDRYDSYGYSLTAATESKALAAAQIRSANFDRALSRSIASGLTPLSPGEKTDLIRLEKELLTLGGRLVAETVSLQRKMTDSVITDEMKSMSVEVGELDAEGDGGEYVPAKDDEGIIVDAVIEEKNVTETSSEAATGREGTSKKAEVKKSGLKSMLKSRTLKNDLKELSELNTEVTKLELAFVRSVIEILGPERANAVRAAILGNEAGGTAAAGTLLKSLQERPLKSVLTSLGYGDGAADGRKKSLFVCEFPGDVTASQVSELREEVTAIVRSAKSGDEALIVLQSGGGTVTGYGLAASQLARFKEAGLKLTICVEQVAASGGYMMACTADKIVASPFAVLGSIGVISDVPNFFNRLQREGIEFQTITAGKYKRTVTPTKKISNEDLKKSKEDVEGILKLFKTFVHTNRPQLEIDEVATGETWFGTDALDRGLCDEIATADDILGQYVDAGYDVFDVKYDPEPELGPGLLTALPIGQSNGNGGLVKGLVSYAVRSIAPAAKEAIEEEVRKISMEQGRGDVTQRYMMKDPSNAVERIRAQD